MAQKYFLDPTFGGALGSGAAQRVQHDRRILLVSRSSPRRGRLCPVDLALEVHRPPAGQRLSGTSTMDFKQSRINASTAFVNYRFGPVHHWRRGCVSASQPSDTPTPAAQQAFNQFRVLFGYGQPNQGDSAGRPIWVRRQSRLLQYAAVQTAYNWDCCGLSVEYRRFALGSVRNENQFASTLPWPTSAHSVISAARKNSSEM